MLSLNRFSPKWILISLLLSCHTFAAVDPIWVALRVQDNGAELTEYHGWLNREDFWQLMQKNEPTPLIRLHSVHWINPQGEPVTLPNARPNDKDFGYDQDIFIRSSLITRIIPLRSDFIAKLQNPKD